MTANRAAAAITARAVEAYSHIDDPRLCQVIAALIRHLHSFVTEVDLSEPEWEFAWDFMARMAKVTGPERNEFLLLGDVVGTRTVQQVGRPPSALKPGGSTEGLPAEWRTSGLVC